jgi:hypothetical protein
MQVAKVSRKEESRTSHTEKSSGEMKQTMLRSDYSKMAKGAGHSGECL